MTPPGRKLPIRVRPQSSMELPHPTAAELTALVGRIGGEGDHFLVVERVPYAPRVFIQTYRDAGQPFNVEYRDGGREQHETAVDDAAEVARVLIDWAGDDPRWMSGFDWELSYRHPQVEVTPLSPTAERTASRLAHRYIDEGCLSFETMAQTISECADLDDPVTIEQAETLLEPLWLRRAAEQRAWPTTTDADRVEAAFDRLRHAGITAQSHFACCRDCGTTEVGARAAATDHGYVFFQQDAESVVDGVLYLAFGAFSGQAADGTAVGHEVVKALAEQNLTARWDGDVTQRVTVVDLDWRKRLA